MKIGIVALDGALGVSGGLDVYVRSLIDALAVHDRDNEYCIISMSDRACSWSGEHWPDHMRLAPLSMPSSPATLAARGWRFLWRQLGVGMAHETGEPILARQIDRLKCDVVYYPRTILYPGPVETPAVLGFSDLQHEYYPEFFTAEEVAHRSRFYRRSEAAARQIVVPSAYTRFTLEQTYAVAAGKITVVPHGIPDSYGGRVDTEFAASVRHEYRLPEDYIFYPANPWPHKNHARLMAAMRILKSRHGKRPALVLSGRLKKKELEPKWLAIAAGVEDQVFDLGFVPSTQLPALYAGARCLVFPSLFEGFGIPLIEAMACGCPIAAANATAVPECVGDAAELFDPLDAESIAASLDRLLTDADQRTALRQAGYTRVERFRWHNVVPQMVAVYRAAAARS